METPLTSSPLTPTSPSSGPRRKSDHRSTAPASRAPATTVNRLDSTAPSPSPSPSQRLPPHRPIIPPAPPPVELADHSDGRYSLRARQARQLNPYEYDKRLYKQQMRANPEAIVKVVSPPRPRKTHRSRSAGANGADGSSGAEDEYHGGAEDEVGLDEDARWERRLHKGKAREVEEGRGRAGQPAWLPDVLKEPLSGSSTEEEDATLDALARRLERERRKKEKEERLREKEERRKKHKPHPFPLRKKDMQSSVSPTRNQVRYFALH